MGDFFQSIADVEATEAEAPALAASIVKWLADAGIIAADPTDCVLGASIGYPPGPNHVAAVTQPEEITLWLRTSGVEVHTAKTVFFPMTGERGTVTCPRCGQDTDLDDPAEGDAHWERVNDALTQWWEGGTGVVACPHCQEPSDLNDWQWTDDDWPIAVGFLGFTFWNWPTLSESFIAEVAARLGHRVVVTIGKL